MADSTVRLDKNHRTPEPPNSRTPLRSFGELRFNEVRDEPPLVAERQQVVDPRPVSNQS